MFAVLLGYLLWSVRCVKL
uniref:Uncharacterized protein n=1 Tax=Rhizophora mucronata TaxID=61149 RepID=A0A2P2JSF6_RHIMU